MTIANEEEFQRFMREVDAELRTSSVPITARPLKGWLIASSRLKAGLRLSPPTRMPTPGIYSGDDLTLRIHEWFENLYGDRIKVDFSTGHTLAVIRGDAYRMLLTRGWVRVQVVCDPATHGTGAHGGRSVIVNALDLIEGLQPTLSAQLHKLELLTIGTHATRALNQFAVIEKLYKIGFGPEAKGDLRTSVDCVLRSPPQLGLSRYHSEQAVEKYLKTYLKVKGATFPTNGRKGHDLDHLADLAHKVGMPPLPTPLLNAAKCAGGVRYGEETSTISQALAAHEAAVSLCAKVATATPTGERRALVHFHFGPGR